MKSWIIRNILKRKIKTNNIPAMSVVHLVEVGDEQLAVLQVVEDGIRTVSHCQPLHGHLEVSVSIQSL